MSKKKVIPKKRFQGFEYIWRKKTLDSVANNYDNLRIPVTASDRLKGETPYYGANGIQDYVDGFTHNGEYVLLAEDGANDLRDYPVHYVNGQVWVNNHAHVLQGNKGILNNYFLMYRLKSINMEPYLVGGGRAKLNANIMMNIDLSIPQIKEQEKIGKFFKKTDKMILLQQCKVNQLKDIKSAYLSEMFPKEGEKYPKKRFEGFIEPWKEYNLGEVAQIKTGNTNVQDAVLNGEYTFFDRSTDIKRIDKYYYDEETIIYPGEGSEFYPRHFSGKYALHQRAYSITSDIVNLEYLANMMMLRNNHFTNNAVGSTVKSLRMENFINCKIFIPPIGEQKKIAKLFKNINSQISIEEEKLEKLEKLKQAYLNDMFI